MSKQHTEICMKIMQAYLEGEAIQYQSLVDKKWYMTSSPAWNFNDIQYRIKPKSWHEKVTVHGTLCWVGADEDRDPTIIVEYDFIRKHPYKDADNNWHKNATPLTQCEALELIAEEE